MKYHIKSNKITIPIGAIKKFLGITHPSVLNYMDIVLKILLKFQKKTDIISFAI